MKSRTIILPFLILIALLLVGLGITQAQKKRAQRQETPNERFYRKGGKSTKAAIIVQNGQLTTAAIAQGRDLSLYDDGGHANCRAGMVRFQGESAADFNSENCRILKVRDFIWEHWQNKRKGYIRISFDSVDAVSTSHIFVEPDQNGKWHVAWRIVRHFGEITDITDIISVERAEPKRTDRGGGSYVLVFKDRDGDEEERL
jgi:hypothetical protein